MHATNVTRKKHERAGRQQSAGGGGAGVSSETTTYAILLIARFTADTVTRWLCILQTLVISDSRTQSARTGILRPPYAQRTPPTLNQRSYSPTHLITVSLGVWFLKRFCDDLPPSVRNCLCREPASWNAKYARKKARTIAHRNTATGSAPTSSRTNAIELFFSTLTMSCRIRSRFFSRISPTWYLTRPA